MIAGIVLFGLIGICFVGMIHESLKLRCGVREGKIRVHRLRPGGFLVESIQ